MKQMLIYEQVVPVSIEQHANHAYLAPAGFDFARHTNSVPVMAQEFSLAAMHYPIVFGQANDGVVPAVVLGIRDSENVFVGKGGVWDAHYIPAFIRRYPFVFGTNEQAETFTLMVDEGAAGFKKNGKGEKLFDAKGGQTEFLKNVLNFLGEYQAQSQLTQAFCKKLTELELLEASEAHVPLPGDPERRLNGFLMVNREKLQNLPADKVAELNKTGALELIHLHLFSLNNLMRLQEKMAKAVA